MREVRTAGRAPRGRLTTVRPTLREFYFFGGNSHEKNDCPASRRATAARRLRPARVCRRGERRVGSGADPGGDSRAKDDNVKAAINTGDFATGYGIAVKTTHADESYTWAYADGVEGPIACTISMKEPGGYYGEYIAHQLSYTDERGDYPGLSDEQFANFRAVQTTGIGQNTLYRSASPVDPQHNRNAFADAALKAHGMTVIMDLKDDEATLTAFPGYGESYYATVSHIALNTGMDFTSTDNRGKLARGLRFFAENPGVYAVHCLEGKDRTGIVCALLECLMGASLEEVVSDYMLTFYNYYGVEPGSVKYEIVSHGNILKNLQKLFEAEDLENADLAACAEDYIRGLGLSDGELQSLKANLSADHSRC